MLPLYTQRLFDLCDVMVKNVRGIFSERYCREQAEWEGGIAVKHVWAEGSGQNVIQ